MASFAHRCRAIAPVGFQPKHYPRRVGPKMAVHFQEYAIVVLVDLVVVGVVTNHGPPVRARLSVKRLT